jgi:hypothetical protein
MKIRYNTTAEGSIE